VATREEFGPNTWLVEELYRQYQEDPDSVSEVWREFFEDYRPRFGDGQRPKPDAETVVRAGEVVNELQEVPEARHPEPEPKPLPEPEPQPPEPMPHPEPPPGAEGGEALSGVSKVIAQRMEESLGVPTATSFRTISAKLLEINREILNRQLVREGRGKVSFTHLIAYAVVRAIAEMPEMNTIYAMAAGKPTRVRHEHVNLGLAVDVKRDEQRILLVPNIKRAHSLSFAEFHKAYEELIDKVNRNKLSPDDFASTTVTITNPGMLGTVQSVPRLMAGQAVIMGVGAIDLPAEWKGADPDTVAELGVGKVLTLTSTYDHRVIQGAQSGEFLARVEQLLLGEGTFYERIFKSMGVPYTAVRFRADAKPREGSLERDEQLMHLRHLIQMYRVRGHLIADLDPLKMKPIELHPELDPATYGFTIWDLDRTFPTGTLAGRREMKLRDILALLRDAYCRTGSVEYMHMSEPDQKEWIQEHVEGEAVQCTLDDKKRILQKLGETEGLEQFLHTRYLGHRRYSLEGSESAIPILDAILSDAADAEMPEAVIGMSHRGRLDVLTAIVGKSYADVFREFEGSIDPTTTQGSGDVKYHIGAEGKFTAPSGNQLLLHVASNPSHLEAIDPVVEGMVRAKQDVMDQPEEAAILPLLIHGDAAFAGQGVVAETLAMSAIHGYGNGGTIHLIVNNQLGFTTGSDYGRSSTYASDVAKMVQAPIFHVNGDDPEACVRAARLAFAFRQRYLERLVNKGDLSLEEGEQFLKEFRERLDRAFDELPKEEKEGPAPQAMDLDQQKPVPFDRTPVETAVEREKLDRMIEGITSVPEGFKVHEKLEKWWATNRKALDEDKVMWPLAEQLAWGSLLMEGRTVRLSGQDSRRGTFNQRHSVVVDQETGREFEPLGALAKEHGGRFFTLDSLLSEFAVMGFEYGYSVANPDALVMWEAQFGDFANGAQVVIDQFLVAGEDKWAQPSGLVLLLPHGFEGQGPEHSSARIERFLQLAAEDNIQVVVPSTPAQYFHVLRRQALRERKKPLVVFTPKSLLRMAAASSPAEDFTTNTFRPVLPDPDPPANPSRVILTSGKLFYDLVKARKDQPVAIVRVEELYPFPEEELKAELEKYQGAEIVWAQEEPENMGAWWHMERLCRERLGVALKVVAREASGSPATGSQTIHKQEHARLIQEALQNR
jgi:2-oxoglutarate decarboxylase